jgi:histidinol-phosphate aminotransferase
MNLWENNIRSVTPYTPGEQPKGDNIIKLNTNECPYPPAPAVAKAMQDMNTDRFRLYPDPEATALVKELAEYYDVKPEQVFVGVGSDDVLGMAFLTFFNSEKSILFPDITYSFYDVWAELFHIKYETVALDENFEINPKDYEKENGGIIFPNPNAPTAIALPLASVEEIIQKNQDSVVIVDEAYIDFGGESALSLIEKYENLLVVRTFSKSRAMAGMRIGFAMGSEKLISAMQAVKFSYNSYTMNQTSIDAGVAAIREDAYFKNIVSDIVATREKAKKNLAELGFTFTDSKTNFIFATHKTVPAEKIFEELKAKNIYVRYFNKPRINNYLRITVGTEEEMNALYCALREILESETNR